MIHSLSGVLRSKNSEYIIIEIGGVGLKVASSATVYKSLPNIGENISIYTHLHVKEDALELYGFTGENELQLFEHLISISGIGPKSALGILGITSIDRLIVAINEGKTELLTKVSGIGRKTAGRIILELKDRLKTGASPHLITLMESDLELEETLVSLGYTKTQAKEVIAKINPQITGFKNRLKESLRQTKKNNIS